MYRLKLFGGLSLEGPAGALGGRVAQRRQMALLALLAGSEGPIARSKLVGYLWPEEEGRQARRHLSDSLYVLRQELGEDSVRVVGGALELNGSAIESDLHDFTAALEKESYAEAVGLYAGPFLDGVHLSGAVEFERWVDAQRTRLARTCARALEALAGAAEDAGRPREAIPWWRRLAAMEPYSSRGALRLMAALEAAGDRAAALQHARVHEELLRTELDVPADPEVVAYATRMREAALAAPTSAEAVAEPVREVAPAHEAMSGNTPSVARAPREASGRLSTTWRAILVGVVALFLWGAWGVGQALFAGVSEGQATNGGGEDLRSIAVLPLMDLSADGGEEAAFFAAGIHEDLLTQLSKIDSLKVISRTSVMEYGDVHRNVAQIAQELGVRTVLEGTVRRAGNRVKISVQLIDAEKDEHLWAESYDEELTPAGIFAIESDVARRIANALEATLTAEVVKRLDVRPTESLEAYDLTQRGNYLASRGFSRANREAALQSYHLAIVADSGYAPAWAGLAKTYLRLLLWNNWPEESGLSGARTAIERALELDETLAEAHLAKGELLQTGRRFEEAEQEYLRAVELNPGSAAVHAGYSWLLSNLGRPQEAIREARRAVELDPLSGMTHNSLLNRLAFARELDETIAEAGKFLEIDPGNAEGYYYVAWAETMKGRHAEAVAAIQKAIQIAPDDVYYPPMLAYIYATGGERHKALGLVERAEERGIPLKEIALVYGALGDMDSAFEYLANAFEKERASLYFMEADPMSAHLRADPRWAQFIAKFESEPS